MDLTINRFGVFHVNGHTKTQCKSPGWEDYRYHIKLTVEHTNLDKNGFIIDHHELHRLLVIGVTEGNKPPSCERMVVRIRDVVEEVFSIRRQNIKKIYIKLHPINTGFTEDYAFMELEHTYG